MALSLNWLMKTMLPPPQIPSLEIGAEWQRLARMANFKAARLAHLAGVSLRTLQRRFRADYGITVSEWLTSYRLKEAGDRIRAGDRVKEVALDLGYKQLSHFSREFKRAYGLPPTRIAPSPIPAPLPSGARPLESLRIHMLNSGPR